MTLALACAYLPGRTTDNRITNKNQGPSRMNRSIKNVTGFGVTGISALAVAVFFVFVPNVFAQDAKEE